jgi:predicted RNase H-like HicB family nuclease
MRVGIEAQLNVSLRWDEPARVFVSYAPALDIYSQAPTREGALRAIESAIRLHLVTALEVDKLDEEMRRFWGAGVFGNWSGATNTTKRRRAIAKKAATARWAR